MGYRKIPNLYRPEIADILEELKLYAMEKIHGTSAHIKYHADGTLSFSPGGSNHQEFVDLFDQEKLIAAFREIAEASRAARLPVPVRSWTVYGEAYGGKINAQAWRYGKRLRFVAFDVLITGEDAAKVETDPNAAGTLVFTTGAPNSEHWLTVPAAHDFVTELLGLEFVHYEEVASDLPTLDAARDKPSTQAKRNGIEGDQPTEGVVLRSLTEKPAHHFDRMMAKHKRKEERETKTDFQPGDKVAVYEAAQAIAQEWVTEERLNHVIQKVCLADAPSVKDFAKIINGMVDDVITEGGEMLVDTPEARKAIGAKASKLFKKRLGIG
jgi:hypothetical protein